MPIVTATVTPQRKIKLQLMQGVHHVREEALCRKGNKNEDAVVALKQVNMGDILEVSANSKEARDADPGTPDKPNPYFTGKWRRVFDEEIGQRTNESPQEAAARLRKLADQIERDLAEQQAKPQPSQQDIQAAQDLLARAGIVINQESVAPHNELPTGNTVPIISQQVQNKKLPDFDKMTDKELMDYAAEEEIEVSLKATRSDMLRVIKSAMSNRKQ